jgi:hypothetical protein
MAGFKVVAVKSLPDGSLDIADLKAKAEKHKENLAACMVCLRFSLFIVRTELARSHILPRLASSKKALHMRARLFTIMVDKFTLTVLI